MSNYNKTTNFTAKDSLSTGDPSKVVLGAEIDTEFDNIQTAVNTKADKFIPATANNLAALSSAGNLADSGKAYPTGTIVGSSDTQTLTNKTLTSPTVTDPTITFASPTAITNLDADKVDGANASTTPTADTIPIADGTGKIADGWVNLDVGSLGTTIGSTGSQAISPSGTWTVPAGFYQIGYDVGSGTALLELQISAAWYPAGSVSSGSYSIGLVVSDGTNVRLRETSTTNSITVVWQKF